MEYESLLSSINKITLSKEEENLFWDKIKFLLIYQLKIKIIKLLKLILKQIMIMNIYFILLKKVMKKIIIIKQVFSI